MAETEVEKLKVRQQHSSTTGKEPGDVRLVSGTIGSGGLGSEVRRRTPAGGRRHCATGRLQRGNVDTEVLTRARASATGRLCNAGSTGDPEASCRAKVTADPSPTLIQPRPSASTPTACALQREPTYSPTGCSHVVGFLWQRFQTRRRS